MPRLPCLQVITQEASNGFHPVLPKFGFGDPTSYHLIGSAVDATGECGAVRHGAECFNFYFPQVRAVWRCALYALCALRGFGRTGKVSVTSRKVLRHFMFCCGCATWFNCHTCGTHRARAACGPCGACATILCVSHFTSQLQHTTLGWPTSP
jgi:hypothetical protein